MHKPITNIDQARAALRNAQIALSDFATCPPNSATRRKAWNRLGDAETFLGKTAMKNPVVRKAIITWCNSEAPKLTALMNTHTAFALGDRAATLKAAIQNIDQEGPDKAYTLWANLCLWLDEKYEAAPTTSGAAFLAHRDHLRNVVMEN